MFEKAGVRLSRLPLVGLGSVCRRQSTTRIGAIIASLNPLILALLAPRMLGEMLTARKAVGLALGFGGVTVMMIVRGGTQTARPTDVGLATLGVLAFVFSIILFKRIQDRHDLLTVNATQLSSAALALIPAALLFEGPLRLAPTPELVASLAYLVVIISVGASLLWFSLLARGQASRVSAFYFLTPVFGLALGALFLGEHIGPRDGAGLVLITAGIFLVQRS